MSQGRRKNESRSAALRRLEQRIQAGGKDVWLLEIRAKVLRFLIARYGDAVVAPPWRPPYIGSQVPPAASLSPERKMRIRMLLEDLHAARR
jgi:hypothetical protein